MSGKRARQLRQLALINLLGGGLGDTTAPTCTITCDQTSPTVNSPWTYTYTFSEDVTGFVVGDAGITDGTKGTFTAVSASVYTLVVTPNPGATVAATVAAGVCINAAGNANLEATPLNITYNVLVSDLFTGADGTLLTAHTPDIAPAGSSWATINTSHKVLSNKASLDAQNQARQNTINATIADGTITCNVVNGQSTGNEYTAILVRATDSQNYWQILVSKDATYKFSIVEVTANVTTVRAIDSGFTYAANTAYTITVTLSGNTITATLSGGYTGSLNYASAVRATVTHHGISSYMAATVTNYNTFDAFKVTR